MNKLSPNQLKAIAAREKYLRGRARMYCDNARIKSGQMPYLVWFEAKIQETGDERLKVIAHMLRWAEHEIYYTLESRVDSVWACRISKWNAKTGDYDE